VAGRGQYSILMQPLCWVLAHAIIAQVLKGRYSFTSKFSSSLAFQMHPSFYLGRSTINEKYFIAFSKKIVTTINNTLNEERKQKINHTGEGKFFVQF
jgi:hypothetical protein